MGQMTECDGQPVHETGRFEENSLILTGVFPPRQELCYQGLYRTNGTNIPHNKTHVAY